MLQHMQHYITNAFVGEQQTHHWKEELNDKLF